MKQIKKRKSFKVNNNTYDTLVQIKKDYRLKNGDDVIWYMINLIQEQVKQLEKLQTPQPETIAKEPVELKPVSTDVADSPITLLQETDQIPELKPIAKKTEEVHDEIDKVLGDDPYGKL